MMVGRCPVTPTPAICICTLITSTGFVTAAAAALLTPAKQTLCKARRLPSLNVRWNEKAPGDVGGDLWVRYEDAETKEFKLNVERQNGRAAMLGITGCLAHELAGVDALFPTGGIEGNPPPPIF